MIIDKPDNRSRIPLMVLVMLAFLAAIWGGLLRLGWRWPSLRPGLVVSHGPLMVSGFLGTLIGLVLLKKVFHQSGSLPFGIVGSIMGVVIVVLIGISWGDTDPAVFFPVFFFSVPICCLAGFYVKR